MFQIIILFTFLALVAAQEAVNATSTALYGFDMSSLLSTSSASCLKSAGMNTLVMRAYKSSNSIDSNACGTLQNAASAGIPQRDVYIFPCPTCSTSAQAQMTAMVNNLKTNCASSWSGRVWLDIEGSQYWSSSTTTNRAWYQSLVDACRSTATSCGVYSSYYQWSSIFGSTSYAYGSDLPLWYAHYESPANPSFSDFSTFGGWKAPYGKQYQGTTTQCSASIDLNYFQE